LVGLFVVGVGRRLYLVGWLTNWVDEGWWVNQFTSCNSHMTFGIWKKTQQKKKIN